MPTSITSRAPKTSATTPSSSPPPRTPPASPSSSSRPTPKRTTPKPPPAKSAASFTLITVHCPLITVHCPLITVHCSLILAFAYLPLGKDKKQGDLNKQAIAEILRDAAKGPFVDLAAPDKSYTGKKKEGRTLLEKHLTDYTARNTFDYFIHKDLGGFLRRELNFYLKNEVLHLDDLDEAPETNWRETRARLKALRTLADKVIRFLAQIEDFQKKLWLKKKFVTACDYVVTLDRIPEALYPEIAACEAQREEWVRLFAIDDIKADLGRTGYSVPLTVEFLKENQGLLVDTRLFQKSASSVHGQKILRGKLMSC